MGNTQSKIVTTTQYTPIQIMGFDYLHDTTTGNCYKPDNTDVIVGDYTNLQISHFIDNICDGIAYNHEPDERFQVARNFSKSELLETIINQTNPDDCDTACVLKNISRVLDGIKLKANDLYDWVAPNGY